MIRINMLGPQLPIIGSSETLCSPFLHLLVPQSEKERTNPFGFEDRQLESSNSGLSQRQTDLLMGKAPLRRVVARVQFEGFKPGTTWLETLECGHEQVAYLDWFWDEKGHLVQNPPTAVRRRCPECLAMATKKKPNQSEVLPRKRRIA
jgi:hypothetical protein